MSLIKANGAGEVSGDFYGGVATQSLRFNAADSASLSKTPSASDRKVWTWCAWVKRGTIGVSRAIWSVTSSAHFAVFFNSDDSLRVWTNGGNGAIYTNALFRDVNSWYHIALTSKNSGNYFELYINGVKETSFSYDNRSNYPSTNDTEVNSNDVHYLGAWNNGGLQYFDGYLADVNFLDGTTVGDTNGVLDEFIQIKNGVCVPKRYSGSYGTNGYRLEFKQTGDGSSTAGDSTIGADTANNNDYNDNNMDSYDSNMPDSPENNFCTLSNTFLPSNTNNQVISAGLVADATSSSWSHVPATWAWLSGKWYWEISADNTSVYAGVVSPTVANDSANALFGWDNPLRDAWLYHPSGLIRYNGSNQATGKASFSANDILAFAVDISGQTLRIYINNSLQYTASHDFTGWYPAAATINTTYLRFNFGQDGSFSGLFTGGDVGTQTDENGHGAFKYAPPTGYLAMCTANLPELTISPAQSTQADDHFNTVLYTGNGSTQSITGVGFQPDWVWIKERSSTSSHALYDSSRGALKQLESDNANDESTASSMLTSFDSDGFSVGSSGAINQSSQTYVSWNWKANGGTTSTNNDGSIQSTVQANTTAGFSIVTYTGNATAGATVGHGLGAVPQWYFVKSRSLSTAWVVYHQDQNASPQNGYMQLDISDDFYDTLTWNDTAPTSSVFSLGGSGYSSNNASATYVAYCFVGVEGYSKFGKYTGNGSTDGTFIYLGFRPAWLMYKRVDSSGNWLIDDNKTQTFNPDSNYLVADTSDQEGDTTTNTAGHVFDMYSNGFKMRNTNSARNADGGTFIYMAFAEAPFKFANAR